VRGHNRRVSPRQVARWQASRRQATRWSVFRWPLLRWRAFDFHWPTFRRPVFRWQRLLLWLLLVCTGVPVAQVAVLRFVDPPTSMFMALRRIEAWREGERGFALNHQWRDLEQIAANLPLAVIAAEDQRFLRHRGFDFDAIRAARQHNARGGRVRGASTISQQLAKNLFLWSGRSWLRKGLEAWYTLWIELLWPKWRILEVYLNVVEFGDGVYGAQAAAQVMFGRDAARLSQMQSARLAAVLPNPRRYSAAAPGPYVRQRTQWILRQMRQLGGEAHLDELR